MEFEEWWEQYEHQDVSELWWFDIERVQRQIAKDAWEAGSLNRVRVLNVNK